MNAIYRITGAVMRSTMLKLSLVLMVVLMKYLVDLPWMDEVIYRKDGVALASSSSRSFRFKQTSITDDKFKNARSDYDLCVVTTRNIFGETLDQHYVWRYQFRTTCDHYPPEIARNLADGSGSEGGRFNVGWVSGPELHWNASWKFEHEANSSIVFVEMKAMNLNSLFSKRSWACSIYVDPVKDRCCVTISIVAELTEANWLHSISTAGTISGATCHGRSAEKNKLLISSSAQR